MMALFCKGVESLTAIGGPAVSETYEDDWYQAMPRSNILRQSFICVFIYPSLAFLLFSSHLLLLIIHASNEVIKLAE
jgi:hypothetical protein